VLFFGFGHRNRKDKNFIAFSKLMFGIANWAKRILFWQIGISLVETGKEGETSGKVICPRTR